MSVKKIAEKLYALDLAKDENAMDYFHKNCELNWHSSKGFTILDYDAISKMLSEIRRSYESFSYQISHLLEDKETITARYTIYASSIERPTKNEPIAHFISIWEIKDGKLFKGHEISQLADNSKESLNSYVEIKV